MTGVCVKDMSRGRARRIRVPVRDEREYESDQRHAAAQDDDQGQYALLAGHRPSGHGGQVARDGYPSWIDALHAVRPSARASTMTTVTRRLRLREPAGDVFVRIFRSNDGDE